MAEEKQNQNQNTDDASKSSRKPREVREKAHEMFEDVEVKETQVATEVETLPPFSEQDMQYLRNLIYEHASDGELTDETVDELVQYISKFRRNKRLTEQQREEILEYADKEVSASAKNKVPTVLKVLGAVAILLGIGLIVTLVLIAQYAFGGGLASELGSLGASETALAIIIMVLEGLSAAVAIVLGVRLCMNRARGAAKILLALFLLTVAEIVASTFLVGFEMGMLIKYVIQLAIYAALSGYLSPSLGRERHLRAELEAIDTAQRAETGTLGRELDGKGYIQLNFFNLFWIFIVGSVVGLIVEVIFHMVVTNPGELQSRAGLLFGPFSPIYGFGAVLMTIALNRFRNANIIVVFVVCTIIGGAFEYFVSWWMEMAFGAVAWDYSDQFLGDLFGGRTCLLFASMFGFLGLVWIKLLMPIILRLVNMIPWKIRYVVTYVFAALMLVNGIMTVQALDCWYMRVSGKTPSTPVEQFYAENFNDEFMQNRFQNMSINPSDSVRG